jgi:vesicle transport protein SEC22
MDTEFNESEIEDLKKKGRKLFYSMTPNTDPSGIIKAEPYYFMYLLENDLCYLTLCYKNYPKKLAYKFLSELKLEFGVQFGQEAKQRKLRPFAFEKFDNFIQQTKKLYKDPESLTNLQKVSGDLTEITKLLQQNIDDILDRGVKIESVVGMSEDLLEQSKRLNSQTKQLVWQQKWRKWCFTGAFVIFFVSLYLYLRWL